MTASVLILLVSCLIASSSAMPPFQNVPRPMNAFRGPMTMMPMGGNMVPMFPPPPIRPPQQAMNPFNQPQMNQIKPINPGAFGLHSFFNKSTKPATETTTVAETNKTVTASVETVDPNTRLPMRAKFEEWLDVLEDLKHQKATDEQYAEAFQEFVNVEPNHNIYLANPAGSPATAKKLNSNEKSTDDKKSAMTLNTVKKTSPSATTDPKALLIEFLSGGSNKVPQVIDVPPPANTIQASAEEDEEYYDDEEGDKFDDEEEDEEEELEQLLNMHGQAFKEAHKPAALGHPAQMTRRKEAMGPPPELWMSSRTSNLKKNGKVETRQEFDMKQMGEKGVEETSQKLLLNVEPDNNHKMQFENIETSEVPRFSEVDEWAEANKKAAQRAPQMFQTQKPEEFHIVRGIQPLRPISSRNTMPLMEEDEKVFKLAMKAPQNHQDQQYRGLMNNNYYYAQRIH